MIDFHQTTVSGASYEKDGLFTRFRVERSRSRSLIGSGDNAIETVCPVLTV